MTENVDENESENESEESEDIILTHPQKVIFDYPFLYELYKKEYSPWVENNNNNEALENYMRNNYLFIDKGRDPDTADDEDALKFSYLAASIYQLICGEICNNLIYERVESEEINDIIKLFELIQEKLQSYKLEKDQEDDSILDSNWLEYKNTTDISLGHEMYKYSAVNAIISLLENKYEKYREEYSPNVQKSKPSWNRYNNSVDDNRTSFIQIGIILLLGNLAEWPAGYYSDGCGLLIRTADIKWLNFMRINHEVSSDGGDDIIFDYDGLENFEKKQKYKNKIKKLKAKIAVLKSQLNNYKK